MSVWSMAVGGFHMWSYVVIATINYYLVVTLYLPRTTYPVAAKKPKPAEVKTGYCRSSALLAASF